MKLFLLIVFSVCSHLAFSWGKQGHYITGDIAFMVSSQATRDSVSKYTNGAKWAELANWMDEVRNDNSYDYMKPWHYINVEKDKTYVKSNEANVITEIEIAINKLKNRYQVSKDEIAESIKVLGHLVGDMHQPLHVGYGEDRGGNSIDVDFLGKPSNLHKVWDSEIIYEKKIRTSSLEELYKKITPAEFKKLSKIDVVEWMNDSRTLLPVVYDFKKGEITQDYIDKNAEIIKQQLLKAGIRLGAILNIVFEK